MAFMTLILIACDGNVKNQNNLTTKDITAPAPALQSMESKVPPHNSLNQKPEVQDKANFQDKVFDTEDYDHIIENEFVSPEQQPLSTFSIDVDRASYSNVRRFIESGRLPPKGAVRIEEMVNYFDYKYDQPHNEEPLAIYTEVGTCPWK